VPAVVAVRDAVDIADDLIASGATRPGHPPDPGLDPVMGSC
jgi:hypothetical protein